MTRLKSFAPPMGKWDPIPVFTWYVALTVLMTWPVSAVLARRLPLDLADPLLNCWILWWGLDHLTRFLSGEWNAFAGFWSANIFHPEPLTFAYSEHLFAQVLQVLPVYAASGNIVLSYNLLFLSTFALSGLGMYLLARELTGRPRAAFVAGLLYAFAPYRTSQFGHLQVLSSQWMPFALYALRRYFTAVARRREFAPTPASLPGPARSVGRATADSREAEGGGRVKPPAALHGAVPLLGAALAIVLQALSCGYFLLFFAPFVVLFVVWEVWTRRLWTNARMWGELAAAGVLAGAVLLPFLLPYLELRGHGFPARPLDEVRQYSAEAYSYLAGSDSLRVWRPHLSDFGTPEGFLFPGLLPVALALAGLAVAVWAAAREERPLPPTRGWRLVVAVLAGLATAAFLRLAFWELLAGAHIWRMRSFYMPLAFVNRVFALAALSLLVVVAVSPTVRRVTARALRSPAVFLFVGLLVSTWLSFGPHVRTKHHGLTGDTVYVWLYHYVPGYDGLRVPARFAMLGAMFLAGLSAWSLSALDRLKRWGPVAMALVAIVFLAEAWIAPVQVKALEWQRRDTGRVGQVVREADLERLYEFVARLRSVDSEERRRGTVVLELPFGQLHDEARAVYFSARHGHPIVNGYSGGFPASYLRRREALVDPPSRSDEAWQALIESGATCVIVHEWAFEGWNGAAVSRWLEARGARPLAKIGSAQVYGLRVDR